MIGGWRRQRRQPRVSVVIASYRWPEALRLSLASALAQTVADIEVLVIEDGRDRGSRAVVRDAGDDRARWMGLRSPAGTQSGPNTRGRAVARAPVVAYLGHDDIWHEEHLADLLSALDRDVDAVHSIALYLRPDRRQAAAITGGKAWTPEAFVPPSSLAHWRDSPRIGAWAAPDETGVPVDHAFLLACHRRGARFVTTGAATVFKPPAAWHLDCYKTRDVGPQLRLREQLANDGGLGERMLTEARAAGILDWLAAPPAAGAGVIADWSRRMKGLPARFGPPLHCWRPDPALPMPGWHPGEQDTAGSFAWTGADDRAFVRLDAPGDGELGVRVLVRHAVAAEQLEHLVVDLDGDCVPVSASSSADGATVLTGWLGRGAGDRTVEVGLTTTTIRPRDRDPAANDDRALGIAVAEIEVLARKARC